MCVLFILNVSVPTVCEVPEGEKSWHWDLKANLKRSFIAWTSLAHAGALAATWGMTVSIFVVHQG